MENKTEQKAMKHFWTARRLISTLTVLTLVAVFGVSSCNSTDVTTPTAAPPRSAEARSEPGNVLNSLPANVLDAELKAASGSPIRLADYSGKVLLVNLWATWCGPCRLETPELVKLHKEFQSRGVEMIGLSTENPDMSAERVKEFVKAYNVDYHVGWATPEVALTLMQGRESIPQSFVITREGRIIKRFVGFSPLDTPPKLRQALEEALAAKG
jgi:cytochrome c biogenesis protein CcmG/thiol:disulfide interchange protein DsbE